ncbi:hypothetical protein LPB72_09500 [Hydrogenophaga crassostreae]|uniref:DUF1566 domain-containing protein n=1 Tax=Hydrogenophaga crassostreae TaxID=1763535 RepID=A0A167I3Y8_9BURK|nr:DUF1566 domain-containing protein [Hydrogenophaga crassostreae]AOW13284.1 hypothetical protein LPB072_10895 [Hydrogenophaga crassostreae]OAD42106.1 hypothetical protein LPB72_09500 [Hydrogenophaga crassostreae]
MPTIPDKKTALVWLAALGVAALTACGGGGGGSATDSVGKASTETRAVSDPMETTAAPPLANALALQEEGARLNTAELEAIAKTGVLPKPFDGPLLSGAAGSTKATLDPAPGVNAETKSAASRTAVYRFFNSQTSAHFFTTSVTERDNVRATLPHMAYEGPAFYASGTTVPGLSPVHRFNNNQTGVHFYTISETERAHIAATMPEFVYEGIAYYASTLAGTGYTPLYRFFVSDKRFHFYTASQSERDNIIATLPQYSYEGVGYYVLSNDWQTPAVPHTGISFGQCYQPGGNTLVPCDTPAARELNADQDGRRTGVNSMSYSQVLSGYVGTFPFSFPLYYPKTDCVRDDVTGLIWEGKTDTFTLHNGLITFTNFGDGRAGDASQLVSHANDNALCGFTDWRLPSVEELHGIVDHRPTSGPRIRVVDFPNTANYYWSNEAYGGFENGAWVAGFAGGGDDATTRDMRISARLVRGEAWSGTRYIVTSATYLSDGANNAVIDRKTGLTWRRCLEGQFWTGSNCIGAATPFTHVNALHRGHNIAGWRLPNIKELSSLADRSRQIPALDPDAFPGLGGGVDTWSSTPVPGTANAAYVGFAVGITGNYVRSGALAAHLVLASP